MAASRPLGTGSVQSKENRDGTDTYYAVFRFAGRQRWLRAGASADDAERLLVQCWQIRREHGAEALEGFISGRVRSPARAAVPHGAASSSDEASPDESAQLSDSYLFADYAEQWLATREHAPRKPSTLRDAAGIVRNVLVPAIGPKPLAKIEKKDAWEIVVGRVEGRTPTRQVDENGRRTRVKHKVSLKTALNELAVLSKMMADAVEGTPVVDHNPCAGVKARILKSYKHEPRPRVVLSRRAFEAVIEQAERRNHAELRVLAELGLRLGEMLALRVSDFDPDSQTLSVQTTWSRATRGAPKSETSQRTLPLSNAMTEILKEHLRRFRTDARLDEPLFPGPSGCPADASHWRETVFYPAVEKARSIVEAGAIPADVVPHSLRHSAAVEMLSRGRSMEQVRATLGHSTITITMDLYGRRSSGEFGRPADVL